MAGVALDALQLVQIVAQLGVAEGNAQLARLEALPRHGGDVEPRLGREHDALDLPAKERLHVLDLLLAHAGLVHDQALDRIDLHEARDLGVVLGELLVAQDRDLAAPQYVADALPHPRDPEIAAARDVVADDEERP